MAVPLLKHGIGDEGWTKCASEGREGESPNSWRRSLEQQLIWFETKLPLFCGIDVRQRSCHCPAPDACGHFILLARNRRKQNAGRYDEIPFFCVSLQGVCAHLAAKVVFSDGVGGPDVVVVHATPHGIDLEEPAQGRHVETCAHLYEKAGSRSFYELLRRIMPPRNAANVPKVVCLDSAQSAVAVSQGLSKWVVESDACRCIPVTGGQGVPLKRRVRPCARSCI